MPTTDNQKLKIGWFSFTCCEDSSIILSELLNDHYYEWKNKLDFVYAKFLQSQNKLVPMDIAFVEGAISSYSQEEKLKKIRQLAKRLVAVGACAVSGLPASQRNTFTEKKRAEIQPVLDRFKYKEKVSPLEEIVPVDKKIPGCPMAEKNFLETLKELTTELTG